jgi:acyl transferase domain-containing protein
LAGTDGGSEIPFSRWAVDEYYDPDPQAEGKGYSKHGAFIHGAELFDQRLFGISSFEAEFMHPQQRVSLEVCYKALNRARYTKSHFVGSSVAACTGQMNNDQWTASINAFSASGLSPAVSSNRISFLFGLKGPSITVDPACARSLVALHISMQNMRHGSCKQAFVPACNIMLSPVLFMMECKATMLSMFGRCATFDASADGFARGEGCVCAVLGQPPRTDAQETVLI